MFPGWGPGCSETWLVHAAVLDCPPPAPGRDVVRAHVICIYIYVYRDIHICIYVCICIYTYMNICRYITMYIERERARGRERERERGRERALRWFVARSQPTGPRPTSSPHSKIPFFAMVPVPPKPFVLLRGPVINTEVWRTPRARQLMLSSRESSTGAPRS